MNLLLILTLPIVLLLKFLEWCVRPRFRKVSPESLGRPKKIAIAGGGIAGCGAAWAFAQANKISGKKKFEVHLFEARPVLGGNAKTNDWKSVVTGLSVLAWPPAYFHTYEQLMREFQIQTEEVELPFAIYDEKYGTFAHPIKLNSEGSDEEERLLTPLFVAFQDDLKRWKRMIAFIRRCNEFFAPTGKNKSLYVMSYFNPMNVIPLRWMARYFGCSSRFWEVVVVSVYSSSFLTIRINSIPAIMAPVLEDLIPLDDVPRMRTWSASSKQVFEQLTKSDDIKVHLNNAVIRVECIPPQQPTAIFTSSSLEQQQPQQAQQHQYRYRVYTSAAQQLDVDSIVWCCPSDVIQQALQASGLCAKSISGGIIKTVLAVVLQLLSCILSLFGCTSFNNNNVASSFPSSSSLLLSLLLRFVQYSDDDDSSFLQGVIHTNPKVIEPLSEAGGNSSNNKAAMEPLSTELLLSRFANLVEVQRHSKQQQQRVNGVWSLLSSCCSSLLSPVAYRLEDVSYHNTFILSSWIPAVQRAKKEQQQKQQQQSSCEESKESSSAVVEGAVPSAMLVTYSPFSLLHNRIATEPDSVYGHVSNYRAHPHLSVNNLLISQCLCKILNGAEEMYFAGSFVTPGNGHDLSLLSAFVAAEGAGAEFPFPENEISKRDFFRLKSLLM